jgi:hypothetical protein
MFAMSLLLAVFEPATTAASMAICRPKAIDDAPVLRAAAERRMAVVRLSCLARNGEAQGKKVDPSAVAAQAIEAQPEFYPLLKGVFAAQVLVNNQRPREIALNAQAIVWIGSRKLRRPLFSAT